MKFPEQAHERLGKGFRASIRGFSDWIEMLSGGVLAGHVARVADHVRNPAQRLGMKGPELQDVVFAALLRDPGKLGLPDRSLARPRSTPDAEERGWLAQHPIIMCSTMR
jgi:Response regulator containing a CheY-like receiver domain and an HD-GYP domain